MTENTQHGKCRRCNRPIIIKKEGQEYGPVCARKEAASIAALERYGKEVDPQLRTSPKNLKTALLPLPYDGGAVLA